MKVDLNMMLRIIGIITIATVVIYAGVSVFLWNETYIFTNIFDYLWLWMGIPIGVFLLVMGGKKSNNEEE